MLYSNLQDVTKIHVNPSGFILTPHPGQGISHIRTSIFDICCALLPTDDTSVFTHACIIVQIALKGGLHQLMKGAYNSGICLYTYVPCITSFCTYVTTNNSLTKDIFWKYFVEKQLITNKQMHLGR